MAQLLPLTTTFGDLCQGALEDSGYLGIGSIPLAEDVNRALVRLQQMLQQWQVKRYLVYCLNTYLVTSTGQIVPYTVGPAGGPTAPQIAVGTWGVNQRPNRIESAFFRQLINVPNGPVDYKLTLLPSMEDYNSIVLKGLTNFELIAFYNPTYQLTGAFGQLFCWPWPQASIYQVGLTIREMLPQGFAAATVVNLPWEYYRALRSNLALEVRPAYGIGTYPGDQLPRIAKESLQAIRAGNTAIPLLSMPSSLARPGIYDVYSDQNY